LTIFSYAFCSLETIVTEVLNRTDEVFILFTPLCVFNGTVFLGYNVMSGISPLTFLQNILGLLPDYIAFQKIVLFIVTAVRTSNLTVFCLIKIVIKNNCNDITDVINPDADIG
jgi:hypothetical protein